MNVLNAYWIVVKRRHLAINMQKDTLSQELLTHHAGCIDFIFFFKYVNGFTVMCNGHQWKTGLNKESVF